MNVYYLISQIAGILMLAGSLFLLYKKKIDLTKAIKGNPELKGDALHVEIGKMFSVKTNSPALGLFGLGVILVVIPLVLPFVSGEKTEEYKIAGMIKISDTTGYTDFQNIEIYTIWPPFDKPDLSGSFPDKMRIVESKFGFPKITLTGENIVPFGIDLNDPRIVERDDAKHVLKVKNVINLTVLK